jgi:peptide deformylase
VIRPIIQLGDPVLKTPARPLEPGEFSEPWLMSLADDMRATLEDAGGVGLAAPQVGESVRVILAGSFPTERNPDRPLVPTSVLLNPRIISASIETEEDWEGCLSFLQFRVRVVRHISIVIESQALDGPPLRIEASGFFARVLQHEIDHLDGVLTLDRARSPNDIEVMIPMPNGS